MTYNPFKYHTTAPATSATKSSLAHLTSLFNVPSAPSSPSTQFVRSNVDQHVSSSHADDDCGKATEADAIVERLLTQAGTDYHGGPLLVATLLPPSSDPIVMKKLIFRLETFVSSGPYSVLILPTSSQYPSTTLLISSYLELSRAARKEVRRVYILGGAWWVRLVLSIFSVRFLSRKATKRSKIVLCSTLSSLASELGVERFTRINFSPEVYAANALVESTISLDPLPPSRVFGSPLDKLMSGDNVDRLPRVFVDCFQVLSDNLGAVGIFRRSPSGSMVLHLQHCYDRDQHLALSEYPDAPYLAASLLKLFLRSLPTPLFPPVLFPMIRDCPQAGDSGINFLRTHFLPLLDTPRRIVLQLLVQLLASIARNKEVNLMSASNLVICLTPCMLGGIATGTMEELEMCGLSKDRQATQNTASGVLRIMIDHYDAIFQSSNVEYAAPSSTTSFSSSFSSTSPSTRDINRQMHTDNARQSATMGRSSSIASLHLLRSDSGRSRGHRSNTTVSRGSASGHAQSDDLADTSGSLGDASLPSASVAAEARSMGTIRGKKSEAQVSRAVGGGFFTKNHEDAEGGK